MSFSEELWNQMLSMGENLALFSYHFTEKCFVVFNNDDCIVHNFYNYKMHRVIIKKWKQKDYQLINNEIEQYEVEE